MTIVNLHLLSSLMFSGFGVSVLYWWWIYSLLFRGEYPLFLMRTNKLRNFPNFTLL